MSDLRTRIVDEIAGIQVGEGYYATTIGITAALEAADALIAAGVVPEEPEWEYGACYQADPGDGPKWFGMDSHGFTIREAAEKQGEN